MAHVEKVVVTGDEARKKVLAGVKFLSDAVSRTLGPYGENGLLEKGLRITNDGISVGRELQLEDEIEDLALRKAREAATKANDMAGDGSTTTMLLTYKILERVMKETGEGGFTKRRPTVEVIHQIEKEKLEVLSKLIPTPITSLQEMIDSATVSVEDRHLGSLIGEAQWELGPQGFLLAEESNNPVTTIERVKGIRIDNGLGATQAINNQEKQSLEIEDTPIILTTNIVGTLDPLKHIGEALAKKGITRLGIIARGFSNEAIQQVMINAKNGFTIFPINAPYTDQREIMQDLQAILGGRYIDHEDGGLDSIQFSDLGHCRTISAKRYEAVFTGVDSPETTERVTKRVVELQEKYKGSPSDFEKKNLESRIAQLQNGFGLVKVGALSLTERKRVFDKVEDAVNATRAALQEGTVQGAGIAFKEVAESLPTTYLLKEPLMSVYEQIRANAPSDFIVEDWVRDPVKVLRIALEQACSVAGDLATVSIAVHTKRKTEDDDE